MLISAAVHVVGREPAAVVPRLALVVRTELNHFVLVQRLDEVRLGVKRVHVRPELSCSVALVVVVAHVFPAHLRGPGRCRSPCL